MTNNFLGNPAAMIRNICGEKQVAMINISGGLTYCCNLCFHRHLCFIFHACQRNNVSMILCMTNALCDLIDVMSM